jgi:hypothetical protein
VLIGCRVRQKASSLQVAVVVLSCAPGYGGLLFAIDFNDGGVSMAGVMRAPLCVVNERRQQMAGLRQSHPRVRPEWAVYQRVPVTAAGAPSLTDPLE